MYFRKNDLNVLLNGFEIRKLYRFQFFCFNGLKLHFNLLISFAYKINLLNHCFNILKQKPIKQDLRLSDFNRLKNYFN